MAADLGEPTTPAQGSRPVPTRWYACTQPGETRHATTAAVVPVGAPHAPVPPGPAARAGGLRPIRARAGLPRARFRRSELYRETDSGAVSAGSNPAGGTAQRHKFELSDNLGPIECQACDLRKRRRVRGLGPRSAPGTRTPAEESPAQRPAITTAARPLPCPEAVAPRPISAAKPGSRSSVGNAGGGCSAARSPLRPFGRHLILRHKRSASSPA
jgi:hypothetical protein